MAAGNKIIRGVKSLIMDYTCYYGLTGKLGYNRIRVDGSLVDGCVYISISLPPN